MALYRSRLRSSGLLCGMRAVLPEADYGCWPPRVGFISAPGNGRAPKLRHEAYVEVAAHRAKASCSGEKVPSCVGRGDRAPRIEAAPCDDLSASDAPLLLQLMRHNVRDQRRRAVGAPLADRNLSAPVPVPASGMPTRDDRCIA